MRFPDPAALECFRLGRNELDELTLLEGQCFSLPWSREQLAAHLGLPNFAAFGLREPVRKSSGKQGRPLVAYLSLYHNPDELEILNLAVAPAWRSRGCAARLLRLVLNMAAKKGLGRAVLEVRSGNAPALALYRGQGFTQIGVRSGYYHDSGEDALLLEYALRKDIA